MSDYHLILALRKYKSQGVGLFLTAVFGGVGLFYSSIIGGVIVFVLEFVVGFLMGQHIANVANGRLMWLSLGQNFPIQYEIGGYVAAFVGIRVIGLIVSYVSIMESNRRIDDQILSVKKQHIEAATNAENLNDDSSVSYSNSRSVQVAITLVSICLLVAVVGLLFHMYEVSQRRFVKEEELRPDEYVLDHKYMAIDTAEVLNIPDNKTRTGNLYYPPEAIISPLKENQRFVYIEYMDYDAKKTAYGWVNKDNLVDLNEEQCGL